MDKIAWCKKKKEELQYIEPNNNLSKAYFKKAEEALESMRINTIKDWKISTAYYTIYFSIYALLMKIGIKSEIHSCTIAFANTFLQEFFDKNKLEFIENALKARVDSQYYIDRTVPDEQYITLIQKTPEFFVMCKSISTKLNQKKILEIRNTFEKPT